MTKRNIYTSSCTDCGEPVAAYMGTLGRTADGKWAVTHDRCPAAVKAEREARMKEYAAEAPPKTLDEQINHQSTRNPYMAGKLRIVEASATLKEAERRIGESCQGMTMDYMHEFAQEGTAARLALEVARERFAEGQHEAEMADDYVATGLRHRDGLVEFG